MLWLLAVLGSHVASQECREPDAFHEKLLVKILPNEDVLVSFEFDLTTPSLDGDNFHLFPKSIGQSLATASEVSLKMTSGTWLPRWGRPPKGIGPQGSEIVAVMKDRSHWRRILEEFTAALCGTFSKMRYELWAPNGLGLTETNPLPNGHLAVLAVLPREGLCTNNITPWKKLLPCRAEAGLAKLAEALTVFGSNFQSLGVKIVSGEGGWKLTQTLRFVVRRPEPGKRRLDLAKSLFGLRDTGLPLPCPVANSTAITFATSPPFNVLADQTSAGDKREEITWTLSSEEGGNWPDATSKISWKPGPKAFDINEPEGLVTAQRFVTTGARMGVGRIVTHVTNHDSEPRGIRLLHLAPPFVKVYYHTLRVMVDGQEMPLGDEFRLDPYREFAPDPDQDTSNRHTRHFELRYDLEPGSTLRTVAQFQRQFMHADEFPPDASRGFDLPSFMVTVLNASSDETLYHVFTEQTLILVPFPDKTMIFNIIAFTGTLYAFTFGLLQKAVSMSTEDLEKKGTGGLVARLGRRFCCVRKKDSENKTGT